MNVIEAIRGRRAVRKFLPKPIERSVVTAIVEAAAQAPSAMNVQPWFFVVVEGADVLRRWSTSAKQHLLITMSAGSPIARFRDQLADPGMNIFHDAPTLIVICARDNSSQAAEDCCLAAENLMLAAHDRGLGTCWIGLARPWFNTAEGHEAINLPQGAVAVAPIVIGAPREAPAPTQREKPEVHWISAPVALDVA
jgi:nitroreductase